MRMLMWLAGAVLLAAGLVVLSRGAEVDLGIAAAGLASGALAGALFALSGAVGVFRSGPEALEAGRLSAWLPRPEITCRCVAWPTA